MVNVKNIAAIVFVVLTAINDDSAHGYSEPLNHLFLCGHSCSHVIDVLEESCALKWSEGCEIAPPVGFTPESTLFELCPLQCKKELIEIDLCGSTCREVVVQKRESCLFQWRDGCEGYEPPEGFAISSTLQELCPRECLDLCGENCKEVVLDGGENCSIAWEEGCPGILPPLSFNLNSTLHELCPYECSLASD